MPQRLRDSFATFDVDGSGTLTLEEFKAVLTRPGGNSAFGESEAEALLKRFDKDGNGVLQYNEFIAACGVMDTRIAEENFEDESIDSDEAFDDDDDKKYGEVLAAIAPRKHLFKVGDDCETDDINEVVVESAP